MQERLIFTRYPDVTVATNRFVEVPIIIQYEDIPLLRFVQEVDASFTTEIPIYHNDGTYLAKVKGTQIYLTDAGRKAGVSLRHPPNMTVCEMGGTTVFELVRCGAAALKTQAELYTNDGAFLKWSEELLGGTIKRGDERLQIGTLRMERFTVRGSRIGLLVTRDGGVQISVP